MDFLSHRVLWSWCFACVKALNDQDNFDNTEFFVRLFSYHNVLHAKFRSYYLLFNRFEFSQLKGIHSGILRLSVVSKKVSFFGSGASLREMMKRAGV